MAHPRNQGWALSVPQPANRFSSTDFSLCIPLNTKASPHSRFLRLGHFEFNQVNVELTRLAARNDFPNLAIMPARRKLQFAHAFSPLHFIPLLMNSAPSPWLWHHDNDWAHRPG